MLGMPYPFPSPPVLSPTCSGKARPLGLAFGRFTAPTPLPVTALPRHCSPFPSLSLPLSSARALRFPVSFPDWLCWPSKADLWSLTSAPPYSLHHWRRGREYISGAPGPPAQTPRYSRQASCDLPFVIVAAASVALNHFQEGKESISRESALGMQPLSLAPSCALCAPRAWVPRGLCDWPPNPFPSSGLSLSHEVTLPPHPTPHPPAIPPSMLLFAGPDGPRAQSQRGVLSNREGLSDGEGVWNSVVRSLGQIQCRVVILPAVSSQS